MATAFLKSKSREAGLALQSPKDLKVITELFGVLNSECKGIIIENKDNELLIYAKNKSERSKHFFALALDGLRRRRIIR